MIANTTCRALILFAHGARDPAWAGPMHAVRQQIQALQPTVRVELAFLEQMSPSLEDCVDSLIQENFRNILIYPMFIAAGSHLKKDLPALAEKLTSEHQGLQITILPAAGEQATIQYAVATQALAYFEAESSVTRTK